jgi:hypothetical protein
MPVFKVHRQRENARNQFRWAPHTSGPAVVKQRDYSEPVEVEAPSAYGLFNSLRGSEEALEVGDVVELPDGSLQIFKYVGLEPAAWWVPAAKPEALTEAAPAEATA